MANSGDGCEGREVVYVLAVERDGLATAGMVVGIFRICLFFGSVGLRRGINRGQAATGLILGVCFRLLLELSDSRNGVTRMKTKLNQPARPWGTQSLLMVCGGGWVDV